MVIELTLPHADAERKTKDLVIQLLSTEWPLSLNQIHSRLKKQHLYSGTYQSVYKAIKQFCDQGVLLKKDGGYMINPGWINNLSNFVSDIQKRYKDEIASETGIIETRKEGDTTVYIFDSMLSMDKFWLKVEMDYITQNRDKKIMTCWKGNHCWWILSHLDLEEEKNHLYDDSFVKLHMVCVNNTFLDRYAQKYYSDRGYNFKIVADALNSDFLILGDTIMQVVFPKEIWDNMSSFYNGVKRFSDINLPMFSRDVITKPSRIRLTISKNPDIAEQLRREIIGRF